MHPEAELRCRAFMFLRHSFRNNRLLPSRTGNKRTRVQNYIQQLEPYALYLCVRGKRAGGKSHRERHPSVGRSGWRSLPVRAAATLCGLIRYSLLDRELS